MSEKVQMKENGYLLRKILLFAQSERIQNHAVYSANFQEVHVSIIFRSQMIYFLMTLCRKFYGSLETLVRKFLIYCPLLIPRAKNLNTFYSWKQNNFF